jgi:hypothetical protein
MACTDHRCSQRLSFLWKNPATRQMRLGDFLGPALQKIGVEELAAVIRMKLDDGERQASQPYWSTFRLNV